MPDISPWNKALELLSRREHSVYELKQKLKIKINDLQIDELDEVIEKLKNQNLLSDQRFALAVIKQKSSQGYGPKFIELYLKNKFVSSNDYFYKSLIDRKYDINIPGIDYYRRKQAKQFIKNLNFKMPNNFYFYIFRVLNKLGFPVFKNNFMINIFNNIFSLNLSESSIAYTAPGCFGMPIRKYFEIPASGALFICEPCNGFRSLGFKDGINCIFANPDELEYLYDALQKGGHKKETTSIDVGEGRITVRKNAASIMVNVYHPPGETDGWFFFTPKQLGNMFGKKYDKKKYK